MFPSSFSSFSLPLSSSHISTCHHPARWHVLIYFGLNIFRPITSSSRRVSAPPRSVCFPSLLLRQTLCSLSVSVSRLLPDPLICGTRSLRFVPLLSSPPPLPSFYQRAPSNAPFCHLHLYLLFLHQTEQTVFNSTLGVSALWISLLPHTNSGGSFTGSLTKPFCCAIPTKTAVQKIQQKEKKSGANPDEGWQVLEMRKRTLLHYIHYKPSVCHILSRPVKFLHTV